MKQAENLKLQMTLKAASTESFPLILYVIDTSAIYLMEADRLGGNS